MPFEKPSSAMVCTLDGGLKSICFAGLNSSVLMVSIRESWTRGSELGSAATTREETPIVVSVAPKRGVNSIEK